MSPEEQAARIAALEAQVAGLREIAISERSGCIRTESYDHIEGMYMIDLPDAIERAKLELIKEHPEAVCPPAESDWGVTCRRTTYHTLHTPVPLTGRSDDPL